MHLKPSNYWLYHIYYTNTTALKKFYELRMKDTGETFGYFHAVSSQKPVDEYKEFIRLWDEYNSLYDCDTITMDGCDKFVDYVNEVSLIWIRRAELLVID